MQVTCPSAIAALFFLGGCSSLPGTRFGLSDSSINMLLSGTDHATVQQKEELKKASSNFDTALNVCREKASEYQRKITRTGYSEVGVVTVGIVAGSIIVPALAAKAAAKSAIAAWGGVSGAANGYQYAASQRGLGSADYSAAYSVMSAKVAVAMNEYSAAGTDPVKAAGAVAKLVVACEFPSPSEIAAAMPAYAPDAPQNAAFEAGPDGNGIIKITPPGSDGGANITDYLVSISPGGPIVSPADFRDRTQPTISVTSLAPGQKYQLVIRAQNRIGTSGGMVKVIPEGAK